MELIDLENFNPNGRQEKLLYGIIQLLQKIEINTRPKGQPKASAKSNPVAKRIDIDLGGLDGSKPISLVVDGKKVV